MSSRYDSGWTGGRRGGADSGGCSERLTRTNPSPSRVLGLHNASDEISI